MANKSKRLGLNGRPHTHNTQVFNVRLDRTLIAKLRVQAEREKRTATNLLQILVGEGLERRANG